MPKESSIAPENFRLLLRWLNSNEELAGAEYERIRKRLILIFGCRGCFEAELLADQTIDRVATKAPQITNGYVGDPANYFFAVANKIHLEWLKRQERERRLPVVDMEMPDVSDEIELDCLESCIEKLAPKARDLILEYYRDDKRAKIERRKKIAIELNISVGALQIRASRIRGKLYECVSDCLGNN